MSGKKIPYGVQKNFSVFEETMVEMTWQEVQAGADKGAIVLLPIGIVEGAWTTFGFICGFLFKYIELPVFKTGA